MKTNQNEILVLLDELRNTIVMRDDATREEKIVIFDELLEIEETNDISHLTRRDRAEFQLRAKELEQKLKTEQKPEWVPVSERLPEKTGWYLVTVAHSNPEYKGRFVEVNEWETRNGVPYWIGNHEDNSVKVVAWMPLPEPYKEE